MTPTLQDVKDFLRVDSDYEDGVIDALLSSAKVELALSGVLERSSDKFDYPLYETAVKIIVARDYEDRGFSEKESRIIDNIIWKLKDYSVGEEVAND